MTEYNPQYLVKIQNHNDESYLVGPLCSPEETVNWLYNQIGSLKIAFPKVELEKIKWNYVIDTSGFMAENVIEIDVKFGDYRLTVLEMANPETIRIHPECKDERDRRESGELPDEPF